MTKITDHSGVEGNPLDIFSPTEVGELISFLKKNPNKKYRIGAGLSGVNGAAVPFHDELYIDFSKYKKLNWIDKKSGLFSAFSGNTMFEIKNFVEKEGWDFPIMPGSFEKATIGGMIACNGGGLFSLRYGKIGNFVRGIDIVTCSGNKMKFGSQCSKISEGPDFSKLLIGSEGSLGFLDKITLQCIRLPEIDLYRISSTSFFKLSASVCDFLKYNPIYLEMAEQDALRFSSGANESVIWLGLQKGMRFSPGKYSTFTIENVAPQNINERLDIGRNLQKYKKFVDLDISFPVAYSLEILAELKVLLNTYNVESIFFGHAGDGNWHIHIFYDNLNPFNELMSSEFDLILLKYGGHISGEHGIGRMHKNRFIKIKDEGYQNLYGVLKKYLDPKNQLPSIF